MERYELLASLKVISLGYFTRSFIAEMVELVSFITIATIVAPDSSVTNLFLSLRYNLSYSHAGKEKIYLY